MDSSKSCIELYKGSFWFVAQRYVTSTVPALESVPRPGFLSGSDLAQGWRKRELGSLPFLFPSIAAILLIFSSYLTSSINLSKLMRNQAHLHPKSSMCSSFKLSRQCVRYRQFSNVHTDQELCS